MNLHMDLHWSKTKDITKIKIMKNIFITLVLLASLCLNTFGQQKIVPLKVGDQIPDLLLTNIKNSPYSTIQSSKIYGKGLMIINFWATWCVPCVREMPFFDRLQDQFKDNFEMVFVSQENDKTIDRFIKGNTGLYNFKPIYGDTLLSKYFPHIILPHNVWIDNKGMIRAITDDIAVNENTISAFLQSNIAPAELKAENLDFDFTKPLQTSDSVFTYRSIFTPYDPSIGNGGEIHNWEAEDRTTLKRYYGWNRSKSDLIYKAFMKTGLPFNTKLLSVNSKDSSSFFYPEYIKEENWKRKRGTKDWDKWKKENIYSYELNFKKGISHSLFYRYFQQDICRIFNINVKVVPKEKPCWVISNPKKSIIPPSDKEKVISLRVSENVLIGQKQTIQELITSLATLYQKQSLLFIDETNIGYPIDFYKTLASADYTKTLDISSVAEYFKEIGLEMKLETRFYPHLEVTDL
jgi:thiol-disulfide isomerase/thioredoxin